MFYKIYSSISLEINYVFSVRIKNDMHKLRFHTYIYYLHNRLLLKDCKENKIPI